MTTSELRRPRPGLGFDADDRRALGVMAIGAAVVIPLAAYLLGGVGAAPPEALRAVPDFGPLARAAPMIRVHLAVALVAMAIGIAVLSLAKGTALHKAAGRIWAALVVGAAITGLLVDTHRFTAAHAAALLVFWMIPSAIVKVRRGDLRGHRRTVAYVMIAMVIVATLALLPGHVLHGVFFGPAM